MSSTELNLGSDRGFLPIQGEFMKDIVQINSSAAREFLTENHQASFALESVHSAIRKHFKSEKLFLDIQQDPDGGTAWLCFYILKPDRSDSDRNLLRAILFEQPLVDNFVTRFISSELKVVA